MDILDSLSPNTLVRVNDGGNEGWGRISQAGGSSLLVPTLEATGSFTLLAGDAGKVIPVNSASPVDITVGANPAPIGAVFTFKRTGAGAITFVESGVTITASSGYLTDAGPNVYISLVKTSATTYDLQNGSGGVTGTWTPVYTGFSVDPSHLTRYVLSGKLCFVYMNSFGNGTSNATTFTMTLPFTSANITTQVINIMTTNNGTVGHGRGHIAANSNVITLFTNASQGAFTASGPKQCIGSFTYEIA